VRPQRYGARDLAGRLIAVAGWTSLWTSIILLGSVPGAASWGQLKRAAERTIPLISLGYVVCGKPPRHPQAWTQRVHKSSVAAATAGAAILVVTAAFTRFEEVFHFNWRWAGPVTWLALYAAVAARAPGDKAKAVHTAVVAVAAAAWLYETPVAPWVYDGWGWLISAERPLLLNEGLLCSVWAVTTGVTAQRGRRLWVATAIYAAWSLTWIGLYAAGYASDLRWWAVWIPRLPAAGLLFAATTQKQPKKKQKIYK